MRFIKLGVCLSVLFVMGTVVAAEQTISQRVENLKREVMELNKDLLRFEEQVVHPAQTQLNIFVSTDSGKLFELESIKVSIDDTLLASHIYSKDEVQALKMGGMQRLYLGHIEPGSHELVAIITGQGPKQRFYKRVVSENFTKTSYAHFLQIKIDDSSGTQQPEFLVTQWRQ